MNALIKRCVLSLDLKLSKDAEHLISNGNSFNSFGAIVLKALSPDLTYLDLGTCSNIWFEDLKLFLDEVYKFTSSQI